MEKGNTNNSEMSLLNGFMSTFIRQEKEKEKLSTDQVMIWKLTQY